jgi:hypothetical protein
VLVHLKPPPFSFAQSRQSPASNFLAARTGACEASLCYAKITPAALHRGEFAIDSRKHVEAVGRKPEFEVSNFGRVTAGTAEPVAPTRLMARG